jgi:hypothetical protein
VTDEEFKDILNVEVVFGLVAQGHIPTIEYLLASGEGWAYIGKVIGWEPDTVRRHYKAYLAQKVDAGSSGRPRETSDGRKDVKPIEMIAAERARQVSQEGYDHEHDDEHDLEELARLAAFYAMPPYVRDLMILSSTIGIAVAPPWNLNPSPDDRIRELTKAGALILAEMERLQRLFQPLECLKCGAATGPLHPVDADHAGWMCPKCYGEERAEYDAAKKVDAGGEGC